VGILPAHAREFFCQFCMKLDKIFNHEGAKDAKKEIKYQKIQRSFTSK
jgi:hypothetical protein